MPEGVVVDEWKIKPLVPPKVSQSYISKLVIV